MNGKVHGDYHVVFVSVQPASGPGRFFVSAASTVDTGQGVVSFAEDAAVDTGWQGDVNIGALMTITGATGRWQGTTGHLVLTGAFHQATGTGEFTYRGEMCRP
jgi:hypothetical protein